MASASLLTLPLELQVRIIELGSVRSALTLSQVCAQFHNLCAAQGTYLAIIRHHSTDRGRQDKSTASLPSWADRAQVTSGTVATRAARGALADELLRDLHNHLPVYATEAREAAGEEYPGIHHDTCLNLVQFRLLRGLHYLPQLAMLGHPLFDGIYGECVHVLDLLLKFAHHSIDTGVLNHRAVTFATCVLLRRAEEESEGDYPELSFWPQSIEVFTELEKPLRLHNGHHKFIHQLQANLALTQFAFNLRTKLRTGRASHGDAEPPTLVQIPFWQFAEIETPFAQKLRFPSNSDLNAYFRFKYEREPFSKSYQAEKHGNPAPPSSEFVPPHLNIMTSADFLTSGEWTGYYDYSRGHGAGRIDPMMHGIQFSIDSELGAMSGPACRGLTAPSCSDAVGNFELTGAISTQTGTVKLRKHYRGRGHTDWDWTAVMTPFGILGSWGSDTWGGWLWLWKKEWSDSTSAS